MDVLLNDQNIKMAFMEIHSEWCKILFDEKYASRVRFFVRFWFSGATLACSAFLTPVQEIVETNHLNSDRVRDRRFPIHSTTLQSTHAVIFRSAISLSVRHK